MKKRYGYMAGLAAIAGMTWVAAGQAPVSTDAVAGATAGGTRVTIKVDGVPMSDALYMLAQQTGFRFTVMHGPGPAGNDSIVLPENINSKFPAESNVSVNIQDKPMWEALAAILGNKGKNIAVSWEMRALTGDSATLYSGRMSPSGPFLVLARSVVHEADYRRPDEAVEQFFVEVQLLADPTAWVVLGARTSNPTKAVDEHGTSLIPSGPAPDQTVVLSGQRSGEQRLRIALQRPAGAVGEKISVLEGILTATLVTHVDKIELKAGDKIVRQYGELEATFEYKMREGAGAGIDVSASFARPASMSDEDWNAWDKRLSATKMRLEDSEGQSLSNGGSGSSYGPKTRSMSLHFAGRGGGRGGVRGNDPPNSVAKAVIEVAQEVKVVNVPYRFEDLPLP